MQHSRFLSSTSALLLACAALAACAGCDGDDECGPGAAGDAIVVSEADTTLTYGGLTSLTGRDCQVPDAPEGVIALSITGTQLEEGSTGRLTLCIPRPDLLAEGGRTFGTALSMADIRIIDVKGMSNGCSYMFDSSRVPTGTGGASGVCKNGTDSAGFALDVDAKFSLKRTCGAVMDVVGVSMVGTVEVADRDQ